MSACRLVPRWWHRNIVCRVIAAALAATAGSWALFGSPASAATPQLTIYTLSTSVGLQVSATVNVTGGSQPIGGTVTFQLFGPGDTACVSAIFTSVKAVSGQSMKSDGFMTTTAGTYRWKVSYSGDAANTPSGPTACSQPGSTADVSKASTVLGVTASPPAGGTMQASAQVLGGYVPSGTITFTLSPPGDTFCARPVFTSSVAVHGDGNYPSSAYWPTVTGAYKWRASYSGDANSLGASTDCLAPGAAVTVNSVVAKPGPPAPTATTPTPTPAAPAATTSRPASSTSPPPPMASTSPRPTNAPGAPAGATTVPPTITTPTGLSSGAAPVDGTSPPPTAGAGLDSRPRIALSRAAATGRATSSWPIAGGGAVGVLGLSGLALAVRRIRRPTR